MTIVSNYFTVNSQKGHQRNLELRVGAPFFSLSLSSCESSAQHDLNLTASCKALYLLSNVAFEAFGQNEANRARFPFLPNRPD